MSNLAWYRSDINSWIAHNQGMPGVPGDIGILIHSAKLRTRSAKDLANP